MKESEISQFVSKQGEGQVHDCYGPSAIGLLEVWEVWVTHAGQFQSRFVVAQGDKPKKYFSQFQQFCAYVDRRQTAAKTLNKNIASQMVTRKREHYYKVLTLLVATVSFLACIGTFIFLVITSAEVGYNYLALLGGLLASGSTMFFGTWKMPVAISRGKG